MMCRFSRHTLTENPGGRILPAQGRNRQRGFTAAAITFRKRKNMKTLQFTQTINAPRARVWDVLWQDASYREWTSVFAEGSYAESDWKEGSEIRFLTPEGHGMRSRIARRVEEKEMDFEHLGELRDGKDTGRSWEGANERYRLEDADGQTRLTVMLEMDPTYEAYFAEVFPKALARIKDLAEAGR